MEANFAAICSALHSIWQTFYSAGRAPEGIIIQFTAWVPGWDASSARRFESGCGGAGYRVPPAGRGRIGQPPLAWLDAFLLRLIHIVPSRSCQICKVGPSATLGSSGTVAACPLTKPQFTCVFKEMSNPANKSSISCFLTAPFAHWNLSCLFA